MGGIHSPLHRQTESAYLVLNSDARSAPMQSVSVSTGNVIASLAVVQPAANRARHCPRVRANGTPISGNASAGSPNSSRFRSSSSPDRNVGWSGKRIERI